MFSEVFRRSLWLSYSPVENYSKIHSHRCKVRVKLFSVWTFQYARNMSFKLALCYFLRHTPGHTYGIDLSLGADFTPSPLASAAPSHGGHQAHPTVTGRIDWYPVPPPGIVRVQSAERLYPRLLLGALRDDSVSCDMSIKKMFCYLFKTTPLFIHSIRWVYYIILLLN